MDTDDPVPEATTAQAAPPLPHPRAAQLVISAAQFLVLLDSYLVGALMVVARAAAVAALLRRPGRTVSR